MRPNFVAANASGAEAASDAKDDQSLETYIGYDRTEHFASPGGFAPAAARIYTVGTPALNQWGLTGDWTVAGDSATLDKPGGGMVFRFHTRDLYFVLKSAPDGKPIRFDVTIGGAATRR